VSISVDAAPATRFLREQMRRLEAKDAEIVECRRCRSNPVESDGNPSR
jgi:hypothetical protein